MIAADVTTTPEDVRAEITCAECGPILAIRLDRSHPDFMYAQGLYAISSGAPFPDAGQYRVHLSAIESVTFTCPNCGATTGEDNGQAGNDFSRVPEVRARTGRSGDGEGTGSIGSRTADRGIGRDRQDSDQGIVR